MSFNLEIRQTPIQQGSLSCPAGNTPWGTPGTEDPLVRPCYYDANSEDSSMAAIISSKARIF